MKNRIIVIPEEQAVGIIKDTIDKHLEKFNPDKKKESDKLFTIREAMDYFSVSASTIHKYKRDNLLKFRRIGRKVYFLKSDLDKKLAESVLE